MIVMRIKGGLGNQLFQYAAAYAISKRLGQPFIFDPSFTANMTVRNFRLSQLCVESSDLVDERELPRKVSVIKNVYVNKACRMFNFSKHVCENYLYWLETKDIWQPEFFTIDNENLYVDGYFQSEKYFKEYREELLNQLRPKYEPEAPYIAAVDLIKQCNSVAVHVRRSDFRKDNCRYHYLLGEEYYKKAITEMRKRVTNPIFFWFSDDMNWVKTHIGNASDFKFVKIRTTNGDIDDMMLMKNCKHIITANSTFSWWAAWLNEHKNAIRIVPERPYGMEKMIPEKWMKV